MRCDGLLGIVSISTCLALGCIQSETQPDASKFIEGIPNTDDVELHEPTSASASMRTQALEVLDTANPNQYATYYRFTREMFDTVNWGTAYVLGSIWMLVHMPPTTVSDSEAIWGPWSEALSPAEWQFRAVEVASGEYDYVLEGRNKGSSQPFEPVWTGKGYGRSRPEHRTGWFQIDFDAANRIDPTRLRADDESGTVKIEYALASWPVRVSALGTELDRDAHYQVTVTTQRDGGGRVDIDVHDDIDDSHDSALEDVVMRSRWLATGAGRADVTLSGGGLPPQALVKVSECWSESFTRTYYTDNYSIEPTAGDAALSAFSDPEF